MLFVIPFEFLSGNKQLAISKGMQQIQETSLYFLFLIFPLAVHVSVLFRRNIADRGKGALRNHVSGIFVVNTDSRLFVDNVMQGCICITWGIQCAILARTSVGAGNEIARYAAIMTGPEALLTIIQ